MDYTGLNNSQFADRIGIPRPSFSQIITGRNKKVSDLILACIHQAFPQLNMMWLIFGEGDMLSDFDNTNTATIPNIDSSNYENNEEDLRISLLDEGKYDTDNGQLLNQYTIESKNGEEITPIFKESTIQIPDSNQVITELSSKIDTMIESQKNQTARKVVRVTVFYDDNSYESFIPE